MYSLGVDIGTTSVVAAVDRGDGPEVVVLGQSAVALPAVVHRHDDGSLRTGEPAARRAVATPHRVATALVRRLVDASPVVLGEHPQSVTTLLCVQLRDVLDAVREQEGDDPARLVLTRPTAWGAFREELFAQVPARLGWDDVTVVGDAAAAAAQHRLRHGRSGAETVAVLDLGAGADATVLRFAGDGRDEVPQPVGAPEGIEDFARACDDALVDLVDEACGGRLRDAAGSDPAQSTALARLRVECAAAKEALSADAEVLVPVVLAGRHRDVEVTREAFEERIGPTVDAAVAVLMRTVRAAGLDPADLEAPPTVLLVGGGARIPLVARRASAALGRTVVADVRAPWAPALGAAGLAAAAGPRDPARVPEGPFRTWTPPRGVTPTAKDTEHDAPAAAEPVSVEPVSVEPVSVEPVSVEPPPPVDDGPYEDDSPTGPIPRVAAGDDPDATVRVARDEPVLGPPADAGPADAGPEDDQHDRDGLEPDREEPAAGAPLEPDFRPVARRRAGRGWALGVAALVAVALVVAAVLLFAGGSPTPLAPAAAPPVLPASLGPGPTSVATSVAVPRSAPDLPGAPTPGIAAFSPNGRLLYLADRATDTVTVIDTREPGPRTTVAVPAGPPQYLTVAPDGRRVYASVWDDDRTTAAVAVIDTVSRSVVATVPVRSRPFGLAVSPDGRSLWVPNQDTANVTVIDTARNAVVRDVTVSSNPHWVAFSRDGTRVYVSLEDDDQVVELDPATDREISRVPTGTGPYALAVHPTRPLALVSNYAGDSVTAFDTQQNRTLATIPVGRFPQVVAWAPDGRFAYVANTTDATVSVIDAATLAVTATLPTPPRPTGVAVAPDGRTAFVTCEGALAVLDLGA